MRLNPAFQGDKGDGKSDGKDECAKLRCRLTDAKETAEKAKDEIKTLENEVYCTLR